MAYVGCGTGRHALRLAARGAKVTGVDFSEGMLARARCAARGRVRLLRHDVNRRLPLPSGRFDRVLSCLVLEHMSEHSVDARLARRYPRARKYVGWPMLVVLSLRK